MQSLSQQSDLLLKRRQVSPRTWQLMPRYGTEVQSPRCSQGALEADTAQQNARARSCLMPVAVCMDKMSVSSLTAHTGLCACNPISTTSIRPSCKATYKLESHCLARPMIGTHVVLQLQTQLARTERSLAIKPRACKSQTDEKTPTTAFAEHAVAPAEMMERGSASERLITCALHSIVSGMLPDLGDVFRRSDSRHCWDSSRTSAIPFRHEFRCVTKSSPDGIRHGMN